MPLYEYLCTACGRLTEKRQKFSDPEITDCPHCGGQLERTITAPAIQFKGGGWYADLYSKGKKPATTGAAGESSGGGEKSGESSASAEAGKTGGESGSGGEAGKSSSESKSSDSGTAKPATTPAASNPAPAASPSSTPSKS